MKNTTATLKKEIPNSVNYFESFHLSIKDCFENICLTEEKKTEVAELVKVFSFLLNNYESKLDSVRNGDDERFKIHSNCTELYKLELIKLIANF